jgi:hypothetical protein
MRTFLFLILWPNFCFFLRIRCNWDEFLLYLCLFWSMFLYCRTIYNMCTQKPPNDYSQPLYDKYKEAFEEYIVSTVSSTSTTIYIALRLWSLPYVLYWYYWFCLFNSVNLFTIFGPTLLWQIEFGGVGDVLCNFHWRESSFERFKTSIEIWLGQYTGFMRLYPPDHVLKCFIPSGTS